MIAVSLFEIFLHFSAKSFVVDKGIAGLGDAVGKILWRTPHIPNIHDI